MVLPGPRPPTRRRLSPRSRPAGRHAPQAPADPSPGGAVLRLLPAALLHASALLSPHSTFLGTRALSLHLLELPALLALDVSLLSYPLPPARIWAVLRVLGAGMNAVCLPAYIALHELAPELLGAATHPGPAAVRLLRVLGAGGWVISGATILPALRRPRWVQLSAVFLMLAGVAAAFSGAWIATVLATGSLVTGAIIYELAVWRPYLPERSALGAPGRTPPTDPAPGR